MTEVNIILPRKNFTLCVNEVFSDGITGIYGPSGSGKTSLLNCLSGLERPLSGEISIRGKKVFSSEMKINTRIDKRNVGYVFQEGRLFPHFTIEQNLRYGIKKRQISVITFNDVVELLHLNNILKCKPLQVSGGEKQRVAMGRALLSSPKILLLDEPFSAVDINLRNQIINYIAHIKEKVQIPVLIVSHELTDLLKLTNRLLIMSKGICLGHGNYYQLLENSTIRKIFGVYELINTMDYPLKPYIKIS